MKLIFLMPSYGILFLIHLSTVAASAAQEANNADSRKSNEPALASGILSRFGNVPVVQMQVAKKIGFFVVRTNTSMTILDRKLCKELKLEPRKLHPPDTNAELYKAPQIRIGELDIDWLLNVCSLDCQPLSDDLGQEILGAIGMDILSHLALRIDPDLDLVALSLPKIGEEQPGQKSQLAITHDDMPAIIFGLPGNPAELFRIDTSLNCNGTVSSDTYNNHKKHNTNLKVNRSHYFDSHTSYNSDMICVPELKAWSSKLSHLYFRVGEQSRLGNDFLLRFRVVLDFKNKAIYTTPSKFFTAVDGNSQFGIQFNASTGMSVIKHVEPDSVASKAGVRPGDKLISVEGYLIERQLFRAYRELCAPSLTERTIVCSRDGKQFRFALGVK